MLLKYIRSSIMLAVCKLDYVNSCTVFCYTMYVPSNIYFTFIRSLHKSFYYIIQLKKLLLLQISYILFEVFFYQV